MKTWFITGASSGFGRSLALALLQEGEQVALTARDEDKVADLVDDFPLQARAWALDVTRPNSITRALAEARAHFGRLDVVVNNAGYGLLGALEECSDEQMVRNVETNFLGPLRVMRAALPGFRAQGGGHFINLGAAASVSNYAGFSVYGGAKAGMELASEAVAAEGAACGVKVTVVIPGPFRTEFISRSLDRGENPVPEYTATVGKFAGFLAKVDGRQPGDPAAAAKAIMAVAAAEKPPFRLVLGHYAYQKYRRHLDKVRAELEAWESVGLETDFPS
ncbi:MAG: fabG 8 [Verrucomicrobiales bacterium]|nr:fabG 8 [Verrucomicrobiales bacterium]